MPTESTEERNLAIVKSFMALSSYSIEDFDIGGNPRACRRGGSRASTMRLAGLRGIRHGGSLSLSSGFNPDVLER
jgi:hypothetical protein